MRELGPGGKGERQEPKQPWTKNLGENMKKGISGLTSWANREIPPEMELLRDEVLQGEHPMFEGTKDLYVDEYRGTRKTEPSLRVRRITDEFETSYVTRRDETGSLHLVFEGNFPRDPHERLR